MKIFIDAGYYVGKALEYYAPFLDNTWMVYAFEPNEELNVEETMKAFPFKVNWIKKAVWIQEGKMNFKLGERNDSSHLEAVRGSDNTPTITVDCIDFSEFIAELPEDSTIIVSMDIEGAEYPVLRKMIKDQTVKRIKLLDLEFHHRLLTGEDEASSSLLRRELEGEGVLVKLKLEL